MTSKPLFIFALLSLVVPVLMAQNNEGTDRYFRTVGAGVATQNLYYKVKDKDKNIAVNDGFRSSIYNGKGSGKIVFYTISTGPDGKPVDTTVAQADISSAGTLALLTFSPAADASGNYVVEVLQDDLTTFPLGSYRIVNRSTLPVKFVIGSQTAEVAPNESHLIVYPAPSQSTLMPAAVYTSDQAPPRLLYADTWSYNDKYRTEILVKPRLGNSKSISVSRMLDNPSVLLAKQNLPKD